MEDSIATVELGGRDFWLPRDRTIVNDHWVNKIVRESLSSFEMEPGESAEAFRDRILAEAIEKDALYDLFGCLLIPVGLEAEDWTPKMIRETGGFLRAKTSSEDKHVLQATFARVLADFFASGVASLWTSTTSFTAPTDDDPGSFLNNEPNAALLM